ncbi:MAG: NTP transferase domain-containing protein [Verrucomicrobiales bacterium]
MQALILAAGKGSRLNSLAGSKPKACLEVGGQSLIDRALALFRRAGVGRQIIVTGHGRKAFDYLTGEEDVEFVFNPFYQTTNTLASLWMALSKVTDDLLLLNGDTIFHERILEMVMAASGDLVLACERKSCGEEEVKYRTRHGVIAALNKTMLPELAEGEFLGLSRISRESLRPLQRCTEEVLEAGAFHAYFEQAYERLIAGGAATLHPVDVGTLPWCEIDFPEDYQRARVLFP